MKVELTGFTQYFNVKDDEGNEFTVVQMGDENSKSSDWEVYSLDEKEEKTMNNIIKEGRYAIIFDTKTEQDAIKIFTSVRLHNLIENPILTESIIIKEHYREKDIKQRQQKEKEETGIGLDEEIKNKIIEAVIEFEEKKEFI